MSIFNKKGMMVFPNPKKDKKICSDDELLVFTECYCPNGHNLITNKASFNGMKGIFFKISKAEEEGKIALSPVYGCKSRISINIDLKENEQYEMSCPVCNTPLPIFSKCHCGGDIFILFLNSEANFNSFVGACNRIGCTNSILQVAEELIASAKTEYI